MTAVAGRCRQLSALVLWGLVVLLVGTLVGAGATTGQGLHHAGLVVTFADGHTETRCVEFEEEEISGAELLRRSGLSVVFSSSSAFGRAVCRIGDTGCSDPGDCFCQCRGADCAYWAYFGLEDGAWRFQSFGPSQRRLRDGDMDGWIWGSGRTPPGQVTFGEVCPLTASTGPAPSPMVALTPVTDPDPGARTVSPGPGEPLAPLPQSVPPTAASTVGGSREAPFAGPTDIETPPATGEVLQAAGRGDSFEEGGRQGDAGPEAITPSESGGGPPGGLIAFGAVAALLAAGIGGLALRRRLRG